MPSIATQVNWIRPRVPRVHLAHVGAQDRPRQDLQDCPLHVDPSAFEPHYDVITQPHQVQIYEPIMADNEGQVTYTLLRAAQYLKDNRVLPSGTEKATLPPDVGVYGEAARDANFLGGGDLVTYRVEVGGATGPFTVSAELLYEPLSYRFVVDLLADETELTERFRGYYGQTDTAPLVVAAIQPAVVR